MNICLVINRFKNECFTVLTQLSVAVTQLKAYYKNI